MSTSRIDSDEESLGSIESLDHELDPSLAGEDGPSVGLLGQPNSFIIGIAEQHGKSNLRMAFMNMANSIIGAGIIGQPYALRQAGLLAGVILLCVLTVVIDWTIRLMVTNAKLSGTKTYQGTVEHCFGKPGLIAVSLSQGLFAFGGSMAFCVIIGDTIPHVLAAVFPGLKNIPVLSLLTRRNPVILLFVMGISYPLSLNRNITALAKASMLALVSMFVITLTVIIRGPALTPEDAHMTTPLLTINSGFFQAVSVISFAFVCHHNSLLIFDSLKTPSMDRFKIVTHWSTFVSMVACLFMGISGFLSFQNKTKGNVLNNFPADDTMANVARFCFGLNMVTTFPLEIFVCREVLIEYLYPGEPFVKKRHVIATTVLTLVAMGVALTTCNLGIILELVGASSACSMAYILPPLCFVKLSKKHPRSRAKIACYACAAFGALVMVISTAQSLAAMFTETEHSPCV